MKYLLCFCLIAVASLLLSATGFAQRFEGVITMEVTTPKTDKTTIITSTKGDKSLTEVTSPMGNIKVYLDQSAGKSTMVMGKMGMETDLNTPNDKKPSDASKPPTVIATGEKQVINGYNCERYHATTDKGDQSDWWMTGDLPKSILNTMKSAFDKGLSGGMRNQKRGPMGEAVEEMFKK